MQKDHDLLGDVFGLGVLVIGVVGKEGLSPCSGGSVGGVGGDEENFDSSGGGGVESSVGFLGYG